MKVLKFAVAGACGGLVAGYAYGLAQGGFDITGPSMLRMGMVGLIGGAAAGLVIGLFLRKSKT